MTLTDAESRAAKPLEKPCKLFDVGGLYLLVNPDGSCWWLVKYRYGGQEKLASVGVYRPGQPGRGTLGRRKPATNSTPSSAGDERGSTPARPARQRRRRGS